MKKHIVCFGDSNTHGFCADPSDCADHGDRFNEEERWTCLLQEKLGGKYLVLEEGLNGRTTVFDDPLNGYKSGADTIIPVLETHKPVDLLIIMLGTNDVKERFGVGALNISLGLERLIRMAKNTLCWGDHAPKILIISPPSISDEVDKLPLISEKIGKGCPEKSRELAAKFKSIAEINGCRFLDAEGIAAFNQVDFRHFTREGHRRLAEVLAKMIREIFG